MSQYYKPNRNPEWNYGGKNWKLSRSKIDLFHECQRCFFVDNKLGVARPPGFPFSLNSAVDKLLKKEFDLYRAQGKPHPLCDTYGIEAIPFMHEKLDEWRENFKGVKIVHQKTGLTVTGAIDDLWVNTKGELHVVDYKATSKETEVSLDAEWQGGYKRQMEVYQWLLRQSGFTVSATGYFVYVNGKTDRDAFDGKLDFDVSIIPYEGSSHWVDDTIHSIKELLSQNEVPPGSKNCDYCSYRDAHASVTAPVTVNVKAPVHEGTLF